MPHLDGSLDESNHLWRYEQALWCKPGHSLLFDTTTLLMALSLSVFSVVVLVVIKAPS